MVIDVHVHVRDSEALQEGTQWWGEEIYRPWNHIYDEEGRRRKRPPRPGFTPEGLIRNMDLAGVDKSCILTSDHRRANLPRQAPYTPNDYTGKLLRLYPDRLIGLAGHDPLRGRPEEAVRELERCLKELGMKGMKLYPTYDHFYPADERLFPLYEKAIELDIPLTFHMGFVGLVNAPMKYQFPHLLDEVGIRYRDLKVVIAHMGYPWIDECICVASKHPNFFMDVSALCPYPTEVIVRALVKARDFVGLDRVLYGSEQFLCDPAFYIKVFRNINRFARELNLPEIEQEEIDHILGENAAKLYKVK